MNKKAYTFFLKKNNKRKKPNPIAKSLRHSRYKQSIIKNKKIYNRKKEETWKT